MLEDRVQDEGGVVVALLGPPGELARPGDEPAEYRHGVCAVEGEAGGPVAYTQQTQTTKVKV
ncbi:hypothetical protein ACFW9F_02310, partial [Streptomyces sp. NPDC059506]|uniref:hypothetical protein n=1 Tax=Streptomyces sp. NPDC059506 TaxID=3347751 RepID=UPI0036D008C6